EVQVQFCAVGGQEVADVGFVLRSHRDELHHEKSFGSADAYRLPENARLDGAIEDVCVRGDRRLNQIDEHVPEAEGGKAVAQLVHVFLQIHGEPAIAQSLKQSGQAE